MGYQVRKDGKGWVLYDVKDPGANKKRDQKYVPKSSPEFEVLGFRRDMGIEEARKLAKTLAAQAALAARASRLGKAQARVTLANQIECAYLPPDMREEFEGLLAELRIRPDHWETAKKLIRAWPRPPRDWWRYPVEFYGLIRPHAWSLNYISNLRRALNKWGDFYTEKLGQRFKPLPPPHPVERKGLLKAYSAYQGHSPRRRAGGRLSFGLLEDVKGGFTDAEYSWLYIGRAFGLRPEEIDRSLTDPSKHAVKDGHLHVYQWKLETPVVDESARWKKIPILYEEQQIAIGHLEYGGLKRPEKLNHLRDRKNRRLTFNCGRKDFYPSMVALGHDPIRVAGWLGHRDVRTALMHYDDPKGADPFN